MTYVVPGLLLLCAGYGASITAVSVSHDMTGGIVDRFRSLDVGGAAVLSGHVSASLVRNGLSTVVVLLVGLAIGFRPERVTAGLGGRGEHARAVRRARCPGSRRSSDCWRRRRRRPAGSRSS